MNRGTQLGGSVRDSTDRAAAAGTGVESPRVLYGHLPVQHTYRAGSSLKGSEGVTRSFLVADVFRSAAGLAPLGTAPTVDMDMSTEAARETFDGGRFDYVPVTHGGRALGWVSAAALAEGSRVDELFPPLERFTIVFADASVGEVMLSERKVLGLQDAVRRAYDERPAWRADPKDRLAERARVASEHRRLYSEVLREGASCMSS